MFLYVFYVFRYIDESRKVQDLTCFRCLVTMAFVDDIQRYTPILHKILCFVNRLFGQQQQQNRSHGGTTFVLQYVRNKTKTDLKGGLYMKNQRIREAAKSAGVKLWQIADAVGINDSNFSRKLRHELPEDEQRRILEIIKQISEGVTM